MNRYWFHCWKTGIKGELQSQIVTQRKKIEGSGGKLSYFSVPQSEEFKI
jgi:hypothetical protein